MSACKPGRTDHHAHVGPAELLAHRVREARHERLRGAVGGAPRGGLIRGDGRHVDDPAAVAGDHDAEREGVEARNQADGTAHMLNALSEAHAVHNDGAAAALEAQLKLANAQQAQAATGAKVASTMDRSTGQVEPQLS